MFELALTEEAEAELEALWDTDPDAAADLTVFLEEVRDDQEILSAMRIHQRVEKRYHVSRFLHLYGEKTDVWRLKIFSLDRGSAPFKYRIMYALDHRDSTYHVLSFMHRSREYEKDKALIEHLRSIYRRLGLEDD
ncbi:type II toxin-antitoxin system RelE/ParE family toxin [Azospirillum argentinense]